jgi:hypothetical protein
VVPLERGGHSGSIGGIFVTWLWLLAMQWQCKDGALFSRIFCIFLEYLLLVLCVWIGEWQWLGDSGTAGKRRSMRFEWCKNERVAVAIEGGSGSWRLGTFFFFFFCIFENHVHTSQIHTTDIISYCHLPLCHCHTATYHLPLPLTICHLPLPLPHCHCQCR